LQFIDGAIEAVIELAAEHAGTISNIPAFGIKADQLIRFELKK
jgi:hypothetical protein